jgi:hypothetical protein
MVRRMNQFVRALGFGTALILSAVNGWADEKTGEVPKAWDDEALAGWQVPLAGAAQPRLLTPQEFYRLPELKIYKSYPAYAPGREPAGYMDRLRNAEPEVVFDPRQIKSDADWIRAGEMVFDAPVRVSAIDGPAYFTDATWFRDHHVPVASNGTVPFYSYIVREKGKIEIGTISCGNCHTRVLEDGTVVKGAQGNFPRSQANLYMMRVLRPSVGDVVGLNTLRSVLLHDYGTPWLRDDLDRQFDHMSLDDILNGFDEPAGVMPCHDSSLFSPVQVPDLIGVRKRKYLDHTGHMLHRNIGDLMRFSVHVQGNTVAGFGEYKLPAPIPEFEFEQRMSDAQLYALARYLYSLQPPPNPNTPSHLSIVGEQIFKREGCGNCHTQPLYTNNTLTPANGFVPPPEHLKKYAITRINVGTDSTLALRTRKATGYYKVPSLKGVWLRGPFEHNGSVATLEDWFDPARLHDDYVPTGFRGFGLKTRAVKGHEFGLSLLPQEKKALIAFLRTL